MATIKPKIGRIVLCHAMFNRKGIGDALPGIIVRVFDSGDVNVMVFGDKAYVGFETTCLYDVPVLSPDDEPPTGDYCTWMPFQVRQIAKFEEMLKELNDADAP